MAKAMAAAIDPSLLSGCNPHNYWTSFLVKHESMVHCGAGWRLSPTSSRVACRRLLPSPPFDPKADHSRDAPMSLFHPSTARSERAWYSPAGLERWRSVGLPSSSNRLLSSSAPPSRSSLVCRYRPCSRPCPCRGAGHLCVMQPTSRSLLSGTPAHHLNRRRLRS